MEVLYYVTLLNLFNVIKSTQEFAHFYSPSVMGENAKLESVLVAAMVERNIDCFILCLRNPDCLSVSLNLIQTPDGAHECILSSITADQDMSPLVAMANWRYYERVSCLKLLFQI